MQSEAGSIVSRVAQLVAGIAVGLLVGLAVTMAVVDIRVLLANTYVHSFGDLMGWLGVPIGLGLAMGMWFGLRAPPRPFWRGALAILGGLVAGAMIGALAGGLASSGPSSPWEGGILGAAFGAVGVALAQAWRPNLGRSGALVVLLTLSSAGACSPPDAPDTPLTSPPPAPSEVESVLFLLGDPGVARIDHFPVLERMRSDVERWSADLEGQGRVVMAVLGDIVYPDGLHPLDDPTRRGDSLRIADQIAVISGPAATAAGARGLFIPGNHDWGQEEDWEGAVRLVRLHEMLDGWTGAAAGRVELTPQAGLGGPAVLDLGERTRIITLDTAWWLLGASPEEKETMLAGVRQALTTAGDRRIVMAAHHPLETGGPHGTMAGVGSDLGIRLILKRAGLLVQDLESRPYRDLLQRLDAVFADTDEPDLFVGGHEHSLQVFDSPHEHWPRSLVVGSASKLTAVSDAPGMQFGISEPGYAKIFVLRDGRVHIRIEATPAEYLRCDDGPGSVDDCVDAALDGFRVVWAETLDAKEPGLTDAADPVGVDPDPEDR